MRKFKGVVVEGIDIDGNCLSGGEDVQKFKGILVNYRGQEYCLDVTYDNCDTCENRIKKVKSIDRVYKGRLEVYDKGLIVKMNNDKTLRRKLDEFLNGFFEGEEDFED